MSKIKTAVLIIRNFGVSGLFRSLRNKAQGKPVLFGVITDEFIRKNNIANESRINDNYLETAPCEQNAVDIFKDQWYSKLPIDGVSSGEVHLFDESIDKRLAICNEAYPLEGKTVLELGSSECAHTYQLEKLGAASVTGIEASRVSYLKCLITKELLGLKAKLLHGDFREYLKKCDKKYDFVLASGVLYHMADPIELLQDISKVTDNVYLCTHYYTEERDDLLRFFEPEPVSLSDKYKGYKHYYNYPDYQKIIAGGTRNFGIWMRKEDIISLLKDVGYDSVNLLLDEYAPSGNMIYVLAGRAADSKGE